MTEQAKRTDLFIPALGGVYDALTPFSWPLLRIVAGLFLMPHGYGKLFGGQLEGIAGFFAKTGLEPALPLVVLVGIVEFFGGLMIALGLFTRPIAAAATVVLAVAAFHVHWSAGFFAQQGGFEFALLWAVVTLVIAIRGGGSYSIDARIGKEF